MFRLELRAWRVELIEGLLGASVVAFHTPDYTRAFQIFELRAVCYEHRLGRQE